ncbi:hypothetical protein [Kribbella sp. VKM Ac-2568]|uniref:hypothetical protein n=1 Tax=Kribbella sp. VKM Ac-2568 TaxID=2512219 RepID=UPI001043F160|nr:hypothetical protein [Kribbella sp. VKM Ac-2568]TCM46951.1 hypothetical protein EV648_105429 [Kribbella sp. VKM Ac-2568]
MIGVEIAFDTGFAALVTTTNDYAYVHDCGYIVVSATKPTGCIDCRSHHRQALSNHGQWHQLYIRFEEGT